MDKVQVTVRTNSRQTLEDGSSDSFNSQTAGQLYAKGNVLYLTYLEPQEDGEKGTQTTWKIEAQEATLIRQGDTQLRLRFQAGSSDSTVLVTPHGNLPVEIDTYLLDVQLAPNGGSLRVGYQMMLGGAVTRMDLEVLIHPST